MIGFEYYVALQALLSKVNTHKLIWSISFI